MCVQIRAGVATHHGGWLELFKAMKSETYKGNLFTLVIYANVSLSMGLGFRNINCRDCVPIMIEILG